MALGLLAPRVSLGSGHRRSEGRTAPVRRDSKLLDGQAIAASSCLAIDPASSLAVAWAMLCSVRSPAPGFRHDSEHETRVHGQGVGRRDLMRNDDRRTHQVVESSAGCTAQFCEHHVGHFTDVASPLPRVSIPARPCPI